MEIKFKKNNMTDLTLITQQPTTSKNQNDSGNNKPPRAPLVLRIGVTGHRTEPDVLPQGEKRKRPITYIPAIRTSVHEVLEVILASFKGVADYKYYSRGF